MVAVSKGRKRANGTDSKDEPKSKKQKPAGTKSTKKKAAGKKLGKVSTKVKGHGQRKPRQKATNGTVENGKASLTASPKSSKKGLKAEVPDPKKPPRFSWVEPGLVAGHGRPTQHGHVQYLVEQGFKYIVTLTQNKPRTLREYMGGLEWVHIPVQDENPPSVQQIQQFCDAVQKAQDEKVALSVHCAWGRGRTGTMLACFLALHHGLTASEAITRIRTIRPGSIDTEQQAQAVTEWVDSLPGVTAGK